MRGFPGWFQDPTGRHPERYFDDNGLPTQLVRSNGVEFLDVGPSVSADATIAAPPSPIPLASYRESARDQYHWPRTSGPPEPSAPPAAPTFEIRNRIWGMLVVVCLLVILLSAAIVVAFQQHQDADRWQTRYHSEVARYQTEVRKNVNLYADLVTTLQQLSAVTNQKNKP